MMLRGFDHIGIAVRSLDRALEFYSKIFGLKPQPASVAADFGVKTVKLDLGETKLELLEPISGASAIARFLEKRGEGVHHIAVTVDDIEATLSDLKRSGVALVDKHPRIGASGRKVAFVSPRSCFGVLIELCEAKK
jgi:methylmalonyl-CoA epimerase